MREEANDLQALVEELVGPAHEPPTAERWTPSGEAEPSAIVELMTWVRREVLGEAA